MPERIRLSRAKGWRLSAGAANVARPGKWGNPFVVGRDGTRLQCAAKFYLLARGFIALHGPVSPADQLALWQRLKRAGAALEGRDLACWCPLDGGACHADILLALANPDVSMPAYLIGRTIELPSARLGMMASDFLKLKRRAAAKAAAEAEAEAVPA